MRLVQVGQRARRFGGRMKGRRGRARRFGLRVESGRLRARGFGLRVENLRRHWPGRLGLRQARRLLECLRRALEGGLRRGRPRLDHLWQALGLRLRLEHLRRALHLRLLVGRRGGAGGYGLRMENLRIGWALGFTLWMKKLRRSWAWRL